MAEQPTPDERRAELLARRREQQRRRARRRLASGIALAAIALAAAAVVLASGGGDGGSTQRASAARPHPAAAKRQSALVRNATPQPGWKPYTGPVPILEYHVLGAAPAGAAYPELYVSRSDFSRQMDWLDSHGYEAVTLDQVEEAWYHGGTLPPKPVVLSFDDGYRPQFTYALPELRRHGWAGRAEPEGGGIGPLHQQRRGDAATPAGSWPPTRSTTST